MLIESSILTSAFASLSIVYQAYSKIKSNRERCGQLVERCQLVVDRLQASITCHGESVLQARVKDLQQTFELTANTITKVGQQGLLVSLLRSEENAALIDDCQHALTTLVSVLSLEQIIDLSAWQNENEISRRRDHQSLLNLGRKLELGNANILSELALQGATLAEVSRALRKLSVNSGDKAKAPSSGSILTKENGDEVLFETHRQRAMSFPSLTQASNPDFLEAHTRRKSPTILEATDPISSIPRNSMSWANKLRGSPLSLVSGFSTWGSPQTRHERDEEAEELTKATGLSPSTPPPAYTDLAENSTISNQIEFRDDITTQMAVADSPSKSTVLSPYADTDKPLPKAPSTMLQGLQQRRPTQRSDEELVGHGLIDKNGTGIVLEMLTPPESSNFDNAVPLGCFVPLPGDRLDFVQNQLNGIKQIILPVFAHSSNSVYDHFILLCPEGDKPKTVVVKKKQQAPQKSMKAYVLPRAVMLVSVRFARRRSWYFILHDSRLKIKDIEHHIQTLYDRSLRTSCWHITERSELNREKRLSECDIRAYEHQLEFKLLLPARL